VKLCKLLDFIKQVVGSDLCEWFMLKWIQLHEMWNCCWDLTQLVETMESEPSVLSAQ